jgi:predicted nucleic acid-binding protein
MILVDSCVLLDIATEDPKWLDWSARQIGHFGSVDTLLLSPVVYAETGQRYQQQSELDRVVAGFQWAPLDRAVAWRAAQAHAAYKARGGKQDRILGDFWIGAHAEVRGWRLLTRNPGDFNDFALSRLLIAPGKNDK